ncbi:MAG: PKD domain-containing protein [Bacteroidales bacterium]|nr:PKD domain-containing protein [Bacteroidales bacterium]MCF8375949.1 PKD domain-containing protein [Bacteroidales bacterium]
MDTSLLFACYYDPINNYAQQVPAFIDFHNNQVTITTNHFSYFAVIENGFYAKGFMYYDNSKKEVTVNVRVEGRNNYGRLGFDGIEVFNKYSPIKNALQAVGWDNEEHDLTSVFKIKLMEYRLFKYDKEIGEAELHVKRKSNNNGLGIEFDPVSYSFPYTIYEQQTSTEKEREDIFGGRCACVHFNEELDEDRKYYIILEWCLQLNSSTRWTELYEVNTMKARMKPGEMIGWDPDENTDFFLDIYTNNNALPEASFEVTPATGTLNTNFQFDASASNDRKRDVNEIVKYKWDWNNDGIVDKTENDPYTSHTYSSQGTYEIELTVVDDNGLEDQTTRTVNVLGNGAQPTAHFTIDPTWGPNINTEFTFDASGSENAKYYRWDWNNNGHWDKTTQNPVVTHKYDIAQTYDVKLEVESEGGLKDQMVESLYILSNDPPETPELVYPPNNSTQDVSVIVLEWDCEDPNDDPLVYDVYFERDNPPSTKIASNQDEKSLVVEDLIDGETYWWRVVAKDDYDNETEGPVWKFTIEGGTGIPIEPHEVYAGYNPEENGTGIYWTDLSSNENGFKIYKAVNKFDNNYDILGYASENEEFYSDNIDPDNFYSYKVTAYNNEGESDHFEYAIVPKTPDNLDGNAGENDIEFNWDDPSESQAQYFNIYRSVNSTNNFNKIDKISADNTSYTDNSVSSGNEYYYKIEASWEAFGTDQICRSMPTDYVGPYTVTGGGGGGEPCPGTPTVTYGGQTYNTVLIGDQCWLKENLNIGTRIDGSEEMEDNGTIEKYCYDDDENNCDEYGGLYQWDEMMQYITQEGVQGICPDGWHLPSDDEWCTLTTYIDPTVDCDETGWSGTDAGYKMKSTSGWYSNGNGSDAYGFAALPGGWRRNSGNFRYVEKGARFWSSTDYGTNAWIRGLRYSIDGVLRGYDGQEFGFSVRCLKD